MTTDSPLGLYLHVPFCKRKCAYCDFCSQVPTGDLIDRYFSRLERELDAYRRSPRLSVNTVFIGGGTPSILPVGYLARLLKMARDVFEIDPSAEITVEVNPGTLTQEKAMEYMAAGVNRISIGLQSIHENELKKLGRIHSFEDFLSSYALFRELGFKNISVDLMYGIPEQSVDSFRSTLETVIALRPEHISAYGLIIEEGTPFFDMELDLPGEESECEMYTLATNLLRAAGYNHYEISNYARDGFECRHNLKYWRAQEYIGIGAAAHSFFEGKRYGNDRNLFEISPDQSAVGDGDFACESLMMHLRLSEGLSLSEYARHFGRDLLEDRGEIIARYIKHGLISLNGDRLSLTERGFYLSNAILVDLM